MLLHFKGKTPKIGKYVFVASTAVIIGDVTIQEGASIWFGAVVRGDMAPITIGRNTNIQDNATIHVDYDQPAIIGDNVTVGHNAVVHGCTIEDECLIGMGSVVLNRSLIRAGSVVAAGSVVREGSLIGPRQLAAGAPAIVKKALTEKMLAAFTEPCRNYIELSKIYRNSPCT